MRRMLPLLFLAPLLAMLGAMPPAAATEPPDCAPARAGTTYCLAGKLCVCGFVRGGSVSGRPDGWRWDCGALRPSCGDALPPNMSAPPLPLPELYLQLPPAEPSHRRR